MFDEKNGKPGGKAGLSLRTGLCALLLAAALLLLAACGVGAPAASEPAAEAVSGNAEQVSQTPEPIMPEPTPEPMPALPDVDITSWEFLIANSYNSVAEYLPARGMFQGHGLDLRVIDAGNALIQAAKEAGYILYNAASYSNYDWLYLTYTKCIEQTGSAEQAAALFLGPGVNEHQTGLAFDITEDRSYIKDVNYDGYRPWYGEKLTELESYEWLMEHCCEYGFILRYPEGKEAFYGTPCTFEAHFRYVGVEAATYIMENDLCLEEFVLLYDENAIYVPGIT